MMRFLRYGAVLAAFLASSAQPARAAADDEFAWLEPPQEARAVAWARAQTAVATDALKSLPVSAALTAEFDRAMRSSSPVPDVTLLGPKAVRLLREPRRPLGILQVASRDRDGRPGEWRDVLDVATLRASSTEPYELKWASEWDRPRDACLPPAYDRCMLRLSIGGGDLAELREIDLSTGAFVTDGFRLPPALATVAWLDHDTLLVTHTLGGAPRTAAGLGAGVFLWRRGQPIEAAREVLRAEASDAEIRPMALGTGHRRLGIAVRAIDYSTFELSLIDRNGEVTIVPLPRGLKPLGLLGTTDRHLIVQLSAAAEVAGRRFLAETLLSYDVTAGLSPHRRIDVLYAPEPGESLADVFLGLAATKSRVHFVVSRQLVRRIVTATAGERGWTLQAGPAASAGVSQFLVSADPAGEDVVVRTTGFLEPDRLEVWDASRSTRLIGADPAAFDASRFIVEVRSASSQDGTSVDYFLVRPRAANNEPTPTLMTGYGAFGVTVGPAYLDSWVGGPAFRLWLERGGALALPAIRGGGERGSAWHRAAMREKRQLSYDDFFAVAEALSGSGFTGPGRLGVFGSSNGGLLAAVAGIQRPDLFAAVVCDVPLADMLRFPAMGMGGLWIDEYGDPADPAMARVLRGYSPFHNVREGVRYPPFLVTVSTLDDRAGPGHGRKLVARLQQAGSTAWLLEDEEGGHGVSDTLSRPDMMLLRMAFLIDRLMPPPTR